jgi:hypothetical protein
MALIETNPNEIRTVSPTGGEKGVKPERFDLLPVEALSSIARLYGVGAQKYASHNWRRGYDWSKSYAAMMRHANLFWSGEDIDPETGEPHMAAVAFHAMTLIVFMQEQREFDDRYIPERENDPEWEQKLFMGHSDTEEKLGVLRAKLMGADEKEIDLDFNKVALKEPVNEGLGEFPSTPLRKAHFENHVDQEIYVPYVPQSSQE